MHQSRHFIPHYASAPHFQTFCQHALYQTSCILNLSVVKVSRKYFLICCYLFNKLSNDARLTFSWTYITDWMLATWQWENNYLCISFSHKSWWIEATYILLWFFASSANFSIIGWACGMLLGRPTWNKYTKYWNL